MKLHKFALGALAAFALAATATSASAGGRGGLKDDETRPFSWTGFYVGGLATYASGDSTHCDVTCDIGGEPKHEVRGWLGGVTAGYNVQMGRVVAGVEVDWSWGEARGSTPDSTNFGCGDGGECATKVQSIGTVRGRLGYAFGQVLPYITAGVAFTGQQASLASISADRTATSFAGGAGVEYAFAHKWSLKVEYLFIKAHDKDLAYDACGNSCFARIDDIHTVRMGLNYKF